ncbi:MAG: VCBS repeat-containing protein [Winogradskyella sp.]|uniref:FG-GAP repeat domain-containing protein n=1 Tax=Winogradskyella sp. TaxID=1883156 RepID=UPI000F3B3C92|nr:VCBS repeat-containing protein [Winogradskyella sp.]RNC87733.1 MAG: VCBS repeat-containing protein [Winogradskyella sp.]
MKYFIVTLICIMAIKVHGQTLKDVSSSHLPDIVKVPFNSMDANISDIDADGDLDIVIAVEFHKNVILLNNGDGSFKDGSFLLPNKIAKQSPKPYQYYPYHDSEDVMIEDINKDMLLDIVFVTEDDKTNELYLQQKDGTFKDMSDSFPIGNISNALIKADFDNDGWEDFIVGNNGQNNYLKNDNGNLIDQTDNRLPKVDDVTQDVEVGDYDNDGDLDVLIGNEDDNRLLQNNGKGIFTDVSKTVFTSGISEETREADFTDIDNDGDLDIYFANIRMFTPKTPIQRLLINNNGKFTDVSNERLKFNGISGALDADFFDIDNDGDQDLLVGKLDGLTIGLNDGRGYFTEQTDTYVTPFNAIIVDIEVADFNNDGKPDIYLACFRGADRLLLGQ